MDLLKILFGSGKSMDPCLLCLKNDKSNLNINTVFEIRNKENVFSLPLSEMLRNLFPNGDFVFTHACDDCSDLISELYILIHNRKTKILMLNNMINQLTVKTNTLCGIPVTNDKLFLNVQVPSYQELNNKDNILDESQESHLNSELNLCNKKPNLETHVQATEACQYCPEIFQNINALKSHLKIHRKKQLRRRIYQYCNDCNYKTLSKTTLQAHINKNHLNTRPHICQVCFKGFYNRSNLNEHVKTHVNQRNQVCELCGCSFIHKKSLTEHLRLHSDTRPYKCNVCHKSFITSGRRSDHIKRSHMEKTECCLICNKKYSLKKELTRHMNNVHSQAM